jgi:hypothetical protein
MSWWSDNNVHWVCQPVTGTMHNRTWSAQFILRKRKSWVVLQSQLQAIHKLITGQNEIEQTNDLVKLEHCGSHQFTNPVVRAMETNSKKPESDIVEYSIQERTTSLVSLFYLLEHACTAIIQFYYILKFEGIFKKIIIVCCSVKCLL